MNRELKDLPDCSRKGRVKSFRHSGGVSIFIVAGIAVVAALLGLIASLIFTSEQMYILLPELAAGAVFIIFSYVLMIRTQVGLFGEIGFVYMVLLLAYALLPAIKFLRLNFSFPLAFDSLNFAVLSPQPAELGAHFWRHVLFISGVAVGYLAVHGRMVPLKSSSKRVARKYGWVISTMIVLIAGCACVVSFLSSSVTTYVEHYTRFDNLSWFLRKVVELCLVFKNGGYFVLLALMFSQYRRYRMIIFSAVPIFCAYEVVYSFGARIGAFTILVAFLGFYHFQVKPISLRKGMIWLIALALLFSGIGTFRLSNFSLEDAQNRVFSKNEIYASESEAVYCTSFHLYVERAKGTLPPHDWPMFFYDFISLVPFLDHKQYHPQYWYARNYYPELVVPPTTMGILADSAIWGGEWDLLARSLINGAIFALLTRWFLRRRNRWWALTIYIYCFATCIMTIKYSLFFQLSPLVKILFPPLLLTEVLIRFQGIPALLKRASDAEPRIALV